MKTALSISFLALSALLPLNVSASEANNSKALKILKQEVPRLGELIKQNPGFRIGYLFYPESGEPCKITVKAFENHHTTHTSTIGWYNVDICQGTAVEKSLRRPRIASSNESSMPSTASSNTYKSPVQPDPSPPVRKTRYQSKEALKEKGEALVLAAATRCLMSQGLASRELALAHFQRTMLEKDLIYLLDWTNEPKVRSAIIELSPHFGSKCRTEPSRQVLEQIVYPAIKN
ncbi:hypothetical protein [Synechococcus sp. LTW-R]|uniref:hypothetical protein n=1 Tax=Synechococcus sp. LTW-R TaxID=2751170 RepID=UPI001627BF2E|nr:hypothetical protein [Synechococcus sp. LTW-R]QNG29304.1 hypothetical protein H0O22_11350 [Synechococcus sp. LTW-R]